MPTRKSTSKSNTKPKKTNPKKPTAPKTPDTKPAPAKPTGKTPEYRAYEKRHTDLGEERPKLTQQEFEAYEDELLDLLAINDREMTDDQIVRIQELEYLIIDAE